MRKFFHANISSVCVSASSTKFITRENFYAYGSNFNIISLHKKVLEHTNRFVYRVMFAYIIYRPAHSVYI